MKDTLESIRRSSHRFFSGTLLSRLTGMLRDISMAYAFGTQPSVAAFMVAFRFAHLLRRLFGEGALQSAFIPEFENLRQKSEQRAMSFFRDLNATLTIFLLLLIGLTCLVLGSILHWGDLQPANKEIVSLTLYMLPSLLFICLYGINSSFLQCEKNYFIPSAAPVAFNSVWVIAVLCLKGLDAEQAMPLLSLGIIVACICQWAITVPAVWVKLKHSFTFASIDTRDIRALGKPLALGLVGVASSQFNNAIDTLFARFADIEGPAFLWYAIRIEQLPLALFGIAIAGAILPPLARAIKTNNKENYCHFLHDALLRTWSFMLPLTALIFLYGDLSVIFLYGHGDFDLSASIQTTQCLWAYGVGLIPSALILVLAPASYAKSNYILPAIASFATMILNVILNSFCIFFLEWGAISVAIATSVSAWVNFLYLGWRLNRKEFPIFNRDLHHQALQMIYSTLFASCGSYFFRKLVNLPIFSESYFNEFFINQLFQLSFQLCIFGILFFSFNSLFSIYKNKKLIEANK